MRSSRSHAEYCWTASPAICMFVLEREPDIPMVTRLDVDLEFYDDPAPLLSELDARGSAMIVSHRLAPEFRSDPRATAEAGPGVHNAQFETFRRNRGGLAALGWWRERCIEWCYDRVEADRYGDQSYLDRLPDLFPRVHVLQNVGGGLGPWNVARYRLDSRDNRLFVDGVPVVFHHFQSLEVHAATRAARLVAARVDAYRLTEGPKALVWTTGWRLSEDQLRLLWDPYVQRLGDAMAEVDAIAPGVTDELARLRARRIVFHVVRRRNIVANQVRLVACPRVDQTATEVIGLSGAGTAGPRPQPSDAADSASVERQEGDRDSKHVGAGDQNERFRGVALDQPAKRLGHPWAADAIEREQVERLHEQPGRDRHQSADAADSYAEHGNQDGCQVEMVLMS